MTHMKHFFFTLLSLAILVGCSSPNTAHPIITDYLIEHISHPETYKPIKTSVAAKGKIDVASTEYWKHIPANGVIDVVVLRHEFSHDDRSNHLVNNAYYFYMNPQLDVIYFAHFDNGKSLYPLE